MKIKEFFRMVKENKKIIFILSLLLTLTFSIFNSILGIIKQSVWHETISIYYFILVLIKSVLVFSINKKTTAEKENKIYKTTKVLLVALNMFLIVPITLLIMNKRLVEMTLIPSIAVAFYVTIKTSVTIIQYVKNRKEGNILYRELKTINLMDVTVSILTLTNTLIAVNSVGFNVNMHYLTIAVCIVGFIFNSFLVTLLKK